MAYRHQPQPCDTYFVEDDAASFQRQPRDYIKMLSGRKLQQYLTDELSQQAVDTYLKEIVDHMKKMEDETLPDVASIDIQHEIQWFMRPYLVDFLIEAHAAFQLLPETLFLAINLLDRYCSKRVVFKRHYQLVGCASLLISAKYGDKKERVPLIKELKSMCCSLYEEDMFLQMEWHVLQTLDWVASHPTIDTWMELSVREAHDDIEVQHMALFIAETALYHKEFVGVKSSVLSSASLALARGILRRQERTVYDYDSTVLVQLYHIIDKPSQVLARKYAAPNLSRVSVIVENYFRQQQESLRQISPPTPPCEPAGMKPISSTNMFPGTPQKPYGNMVNGYMTPPITPEGEYFANGNEIKGYLPAPRCPVTPTPSHHNTWTPVLEY